MKETDNPVVNAIAEIERLRGRFPDTQIEIMLAPLRAQLAESDAASCDGEPSGQSTGISTHGGSVVEGPVRVRGGHFIGRDFIQQVTNVVQRGEDAEDAKSVMRSFPSSAWERGPRSSASHAIGLEKRSS